MRYNKAVHIALVYGASVQYLANVHQVSVEFLMKEYFGWQINCRTTRLNNGCYRVISRSGAMSYVMDDFGNAVPANGVAALLG